MAGAPSLVWRGRQGLRRKSAVAAHHRASPLREETIAALRAQGRKFDIVCTSADFAVLAAAAKAGLGVTPMIAGLAPDGLRPCAGKDLPPLPALALTLLARQPALAVAARRWVANVVEAVESA